MKHTKEVIELMHGYDHNVKYISNWGQGAEARKQNSKIWKRLQELGYTSVPKDLY